jgi:type IV secretory pathway protease TraF
LLDQAENEAKTRSGVSPTAKSTVQQGHQLGGRRLDSRFLAAAFLVLLPVVAWTSWWRGQSRKAAESAIMRIDGGSMAPSLIGTHRTADCDFCHLQWPVTVQAESVATKTFCFHCGKAATVTGEVSRGDVVRVRPLDTSQGDTSLSRGDLVAVRWGGKQRVKRILGMPGDRVDIRGSMLIVNGQRFDDLLIRDEGRVFPLPWMLVDNDSKRMKSRWQSTNGWTRSDSGHWVSEETHWLVYQHQSHHDQNGMSRIWDDYPFNVHVDRKLYPVDRLRVTIDSSEPVGLTFEVAFWTPDGNRAVTLQASSGPRFAINTSMVGSPTDAPVDPQHPIAIRSTNPVRLACIKLERANQYRIRPEDDLSQYPVTLGQNQYFVVGDNTPISIDSRSIGTVTENQIIGIVFPDTQATATDAFLGKSPRTPISRSADTRRPTSFSN